MGWGRGRWCVWVGVLLLLMGPGEAEKVEVSGSAIVKLPTKEIISTKLLCHAVLCAVCCVLCAVSPLQASPLPGEGP
jgi:hypothetical protein